MAVENLASIETSPGAQAFISRLDAQDRANVEGVVSIVDLIANGCDKGVFGGERGKNLIFGAYVMGGWVNKEGNRPDVDLLVVTNARWEQAGYIDMPTDWLHGGYVYANGDQFLEKTLSYFGARGSEVTIPDLEDIPDEYSEGAGPRMMLRLAPVDALPIDIVYVSGGYAEPPLESFEDFYEQDVTTDGAEMGRVALLEVEVTIPPIKWRL